MTPEAPTAAPEQPAGMSELSRIVGVFFEPKKTFEDIAQRPGWILPLVLIILSTMAFTAVFSQRVGWERMLRQQQAASSRAQQLTPEQREQAIAVQARFVPIFGYVGPLVGIPLTYLIIAAILLGIVAGIMSAKMRFKQAYAVVCYGGLPSIISGVLGIVVLFLKNPDDFDIRNPLAFNAGAFLDPQSGSKFVYSLATSLDLISFWMIFLLATGLKAAAGKKLSFGGALAAVIVPWAIYVLGKSAIAGVFS